MAFADSHNKVQPIVGYRFQKIWRPSELDEFRIGASFTLIVTARNEYWYILISITTSDCFYWI